MQLGQEKPIIEQGDVLHVAILNQFPFQHLRGSILWHYASYMSL